MTPALPFATTLGQLEAQAGLAPDHQSRWEFWKDFAPLKDKAFAAGVAELERRVLLREADSSLIAHHMLRTNGFDLKRILVSPDPAAQAPGACPRGEARADLP